MGIRLDILQKKPLSFEIALFKKALNEQTPWAI